MSDHDAQVLAGIFAKVKCCDVLAMEAGWVWPEHSWKLLVQAEKRKMKESGI